VRQTVIINTCNTFQENIYSPCHAHPCLFKGLYMIMCKMGLLGHRSNINQTAFLTSSMGSMSMGLCDLLGEMS